jgi:hypothetical protein
VLGKGLGKVAGARFPVMPTAQLPVAALLAARSALPAGPVRAPRRDLPHEQPQQHTRGLVGALNAEWRRLAIAPGGRTALSSWADAEPALAACVDLTAVVEAGRRGQDEVLLALLRLSRRGDPLAARTALQVMLGAAVRLARRTVAHAHGDLEESLSRAVSALWQIVREYPVERRTCRPADGISLDVLAALTCAGRPRPTEVPGGLPAELADAPEDGPDVDGVRGVFWSVAHPQAVDACSDEQLVLLLAWGVRQGVVSLEDARLLLRLHSPDEPGAALSCREVADELGLGHAAVRQRASRATRRLAAAVAEHAGSGSREPARVA